MYEKNDRRYFGDRCYGSSVPQNKTNGTKQQRGKRSQHHKHNAEHELNWRS